MKRNIMIITLILALVFVTSQLAFAKRMGKHGGKNWQDKQQLIKELDLTEDQMKAIVDLRQKAFKENGELRLKMMRLKQELQVLLMNDKWEESKIYKNIDETAAVKAELQKRRLKLAHEIRQLLTSEQKLIWDLSGGRGGKGAARGVCNFGGQDFGDGPGRGYGKHHGRDQGGMYNY